ncbi:helix-turn-helix domain-containing protein [Rubellimicrobium rubrum]|uniref:Helix-turn-helix domain-containing protein n=1 Tax=Rubellimicrobium rubrum TaxID=2585369 RepID=A0A5C4MKS3_9RHOB|nr:helix-turn-helix domain-containing protein [Rubellimicrobium rubrum]TNC45035.1 helix-turn-helix domain-containing protein [Rubellimicrobium rubrum]
MMRQVGALLEGGPGGRSSAGQGGRAARARRPVRRGSRLVGTCEGAWWRRTDRQEVRRVLLAAKRYELAGRQAGRRRGPLGHVGLEVLELLANLVSFRSGRLEPAITYLMRTLRRSKDAVVRALAALREHGFLDWLRRHERVELVEGPGPRVRQVSNAYRLSLPPRAARLLGHLLSAPPLPEDVAQEREDRAAWLREHKAALPLAELPLVEVDDDRLARVLGELGRAVEARAQAARSTRGDNQEQRCGDKAFS